MARWCRCGLALTAGVLALSLSLASSDAQADEEDKHEPHPSRPSPVIDAHLEEKPNAVDLIGRTRVKGPDAERKTDPVSSPARPAATAVADRGGGRAGTVPATPVAKESPSVPVSVPTPAAVDKQVPPPA